MSPQISPIVLYDHTALQHYLTAPAVIRELQGNKCQQLSWQPDSTMLTFIYEDEDASNEVIRRLCLPDDALQREDGRTWKISLERLIEILSPNAGLQALLQGLNAAIKAAEAEMKAQNAAQAGAGKLPHVSEFVDEDDEPFQYTAAYAEYQRLLQYFTELNKDPKYEFQIVNPVRHEAHITCTRLNSKEINVEMTIRPNEVNRSIDFVWESGRYADFYELSAISILDRAQKAGRINFRLAITPESEAQAFRAALAVELSSSKITKPSLELNGVQYHWDSSDKSFAVAPEEREGAEAKDSPFAPRSEPEADDDLMAGLPSHRNRGRSGP